MTNKYICIKVTLKNWR